MLALLHALLQVRDTLDLVGNRALVPEPQDAACSDRGVH